MKNYIPQNYEHRRYTQGKLSEKLEDSLDFDFNAGSERINTIDEFETSLLTPFKNGELIFYRGEKCDSIKRPLLPSIYRNKEFLFDSNKKVSMISSLALYDFYKRKSGFLDLYEKIIEPVNTSSMYNFLSFAQHYFGVSPLIDFTKSLEVALSFALKDRTEYPEDVLIYTLRLKSPNDYTSSLAVANSWIENYSVLVFRDLTKREFEKPIDAIEDYRLIAENFKGHSFIEITSPSAKLIDVPTNDLIRYQQGVFLLLDDFSLIGKSYFTKKVRDDFKLKKWIINKEICPEILSYLSSAAPYYMYKNLTDLSVTVNEIKKNNAIYRR